MSNTKQKEITIVGCGLAGSFLAILLAKRGYKVQIFERLSKKEIIQEAENRSYNISFYGYAINLLKKAGLWEVISPHMFSLKGSVTHIPHTAPVKIIGKITYVTITRAHMAALLLQEVEKQRLITLHFETPVISINRYEKTITIQKKSNNQIQTLPTDIVIGADGINSQVRIFMQQGQQTTHMQEYATYCYKQFVLEEKQVDELGLEKQCEHTWTQKDTFIIAHFDSKNKLSALLVYPKIANNKDPFATDEDINAFFTDKYPMYVPVLSKLTSQLKENSQGNFATIHTDPWYYKDFMVLVGDAAHGFYPFFGQGTSAAFGDCMLLVELIDTMKDDWEAIFKKYQMLRKSNMDTLGDLSKNVMQKYFRYKKADYTAIYDLMEQRLHTFFPKLINPSIAYSLITDPDHAYDHYTRFKKQRRRQKMLGFDGFVGIISSIASVMIRTEKHN